MKLILSKSNVLSLFQVWALRVDLTVLNIEGNVIECASVAALAALAHYRRPDVTSTGDRLVIHDASEKEPLQTSLHHFPICLTYAVFNRGCVRCIRSHNFKFW